MDADSQKDWRRNLSALKSSLARLKIDKKYDSLKDFEKCIENFHIKVRASQIIPIGDGTEWSVLNSLSEVLQLHDIHSDLVGKVYSLFQCFTEVDQDFSFYLFYCCNILSTIAIELDQSPSRGCVLESLRLLQAISKHVHMPPSMPEAERVFVVLLQRIKAESNTEILQSCLESVANMSRGNVAFQSIIKSKSLLKEVHSKLIPLLSKKNPCTNVATLRVLANLSLNTALGEAMFSAQNIEPTFGVVFNVFYRQNNNTSAVSNAVDLLVDMLKCERIQKAFVHYKHLKVCVQSTLVLLVFSSGATLAKLCELFQCFLGINELHQMVMNLFFTHVSDISSSAPPEVLSQLDTSGGRLNSLVVTLLLGLVDRDAQLCPQSRSVAMKVLQLLRDIFEGAASCGLVHSILVLTKYICPLLKDHLVALQHSDGQGLQQYLSGADASLDIALAIACIDTAPGEVAQFINADVLRSTWDCISSAPSQPWWSMSLSEDVKKHIVYDSRSCSELKLSSLIKLLELLKLLSSSSVSCCALLQSLLQEGGAVVLVGQALLSEDGGDVGRAIRVIQHTGTLQMDASHGLRDGVMTACGEYAVEVERRVRVSTPCVREHLQSTFKPALEEPPHPDCQHHPILVKTHHSPTHDPQTHPSKESKTADGLSPSLDVDTEAVEKLIHMMKTGMKMKDIRSSEIMMVYECKLQNMQTKENHLQELLEAKANALFHADRLNSQYRNKMAQIESECMKLRSLLQDAEKRNEKSNEEVSGVQLALDQSQKDKLNLTKKITHLSEEISKMKGIVVEYEAVQRELAHLRTKFEDVQKSKLKVDHRLQSASKKIEELEGQMLLLRAEKDKLQSDLQRKEEDRIQLTNHISTQEKQFQELKDGIASFERRAKEMETLHHEALHKNKELVQQLDQMQQEQTRLVEEKNLLQEDNHRLDVCVEEQKKEIDCLFGQNEVLNRKLQHIQSILH